MDKQLNFYNEGIIYISWKIFCTYKTCLTNSSVCLKYVMRAGVFKSMQTKYYEGSSANKGQRIVNHRKLCRPGECVARNLIRCWQIRDRCSSQTNPYTHARPRSSIKVDWFKALKRLRYSSAIPGPAVSSLLPWYQICSNLSRPASERERNVHCLLS